MAGRHDVVVVVVVVVVICGEEVGGVAVAPLGVGGAGGGGEDAVLVKLLARGPGARLQPRVAGDTLQLYPVPRTHLPSIWLLVLSA